MRRVNIVSADHPYAYDIYSRSKLCQSMFVIIWARYRDGLNLCSYNDARAKPSCIFQEFLMWLSDYNGMVDGRMPFGM